MKKSKYEYSSVHVNLPNDLANDIITWGKKQILDRELFIAPLDPGLGREDDIHITVLYGLHTDNKNQVEKLLQNESKPKVRLGKVELFTNSNSYDVVVVHVISHDLRRMNRILKENVKYTNKYSSYKPHATIAFIKKDKGWKYRGVDKWEGIEFLCNDLIFSPTKGPKEKISFK